MCRRCSVSFQAAGGAVKELKKLLGRAGGLNESDADDDEDDDDVSNLDYFMFSMHNHSNLLQ